MPRTPRRRQETDGACCHLLNRGHNRDALFADDDDRRACLNLLARSQQRFAPPAGPQSWQRLSPVGSRAFQKREGGVP